MERITQRDHNQIVSYEHNEDFNAKRVYVVNGLSEFISKEDKKIEPTIIKEVQIQTIEVPVIIKQTEIREVEKPIIIYQEKIEIIEVPKIIYETKEIVKEVIKQVPIIQTKVETIEKPIYIYKDTEKLVKAAIALQLLLTIVLMLKK